MNIGLGKDGNDVPRLQFEIVFLIFLQQSSAQVEGLEGGSEIVGIQPLDNRVVPIDLRHSLINAIRNRKTFRRRSGLRSDASPVAGEAVAFSSACGRILQEGFGFYLRAWEQAPPWQNCRCPPLAGTHGTNR